MHAPLLDPGGVLDACLSASRAAAFRPLETVGFPLDPTWRDILVSTTIRIAGLHHAACILATPGSVQPLAGMHAGSLLTCWRGFRQVGLEPFPVLTHWATTTNFMGLLPFPRFRAYLGATSAGLGAPLGTEPRLAFPCPRCIGAVHHYSSPTPVLTKGRHQFVTTFTFRWRPLRNQQSGQWAEASHSVDL